MTTAFLESEIERLQSKASIYGKGTAWKQNEFSEILPFPKPLSLSIFRNLAGHEGATGITCGELGIFYNSAVPVEDYLETLFGRTFVNVAAETLLTKQQGKLSMFRTFSASVRLEKENRTYYRAFNLLSQDFDAYYQSMSRSNTEELPDAALLARLQELHKGLNRHYSHVVKAGLLANLNLEALAASQNGEIPPDLLTAEIGHLAESDRDAASVFAYRESRLSELAGFSASVDYELACPRFLEIEGYMIQPGLAQIQGKSVPLKDRKVRDALFHFRIYESLKVIFKTLLLRELYLLRIALLQAGKRADLADDIFYLEFVEVESLFQAEGISRHNLDQTINRRKDREKAFQNIELPTFVSPDILKSLIREKKPLERHPLKGIPITGIEFEGRALIYRSDSDLARSDGNAVIIAKHASPNLVMAFARSRGIVAETGGLLSHLAIVAREQRFPLVLQARDATKILADGDYLRVDSAGNVFI